MTNLLKETLSVIEDNGYTEADVLWVGDLKASISWEEFSQLAKDLNYDEGWGSEEISLSLKVVGKDWWLERHEYDGSEWWEFKRLPGKPEAGRVELRCR